MIDQEKVMSWLEGLSQDDWRPFHSDSEVSNIAKAALTLLKEQEPHVLTREEMIEAGKNHVGIYVEEYPSSGRANKWAIAIEGIEPPEHGYNYPGGVQFNAVDVDDDMYDGDLYSLNGVLGWRAWSAKPTEEQMKSVPW